MIVTLHSKERNIRSNSVDDNGKQQSNVLQGTVNIKHIILENLQVLKRNYAS